ncbi:MAG: HPF/RaiA family ribosome-associated protein [Acidobacteriota bacterium]|nr:HPF/RaiA family ribosome-associated protein [Acidobacteriota bacterium]
MQVALEINARHLRLTDNLEALIRERTEHLEHYYPRIVRCHVSLDGPSDHHGHGGTFDVHIDLRVPGCEIAVTHQKGGDLPAAIRNAFDAARRQLQDYAERQRGDVKHHAEETPAPPAPEELPPAGLDV